MKHRVLIISILFSCSFLIYATDTLAQRGTVAAGGQASDANYTVTYSIGQTDYITETGNGGTITQGLQQPYEILVINGVEETHVQLSVSAYPNPAATHITLQVYAELLPVECSLFDSQGKFISRQHIVKSSTDFSLSGLAAGTYFLNVLSGQKEIKSFKIIKTEN